MIINRAFYVTLMLSILTFAYSSFVFFDITGSIVGKINITQLENYGGMTFSHIKNGQLWRLFVSQLIHVKPMHILYNVLALFFLGYALDKHLKPIGVLLVWFIAGTIGTLISTFTVPAPWNLGTGASQAILGISALTVALFFKHGIKRQLLIASSCFALIPALALDFIYAGYPKIGHVVSFSCGLLLFFLLKGRIIIHQN